MRAFICVYRHPEPGKERKKVEKQISHVEYLGLYLQEYFQPDNFYDWGDDPSFFISKQIFGDYNHVTWGVCRRNVRVQLKEGDVVIFFCGKQTERIWNYYFIGYGTVERCLRDRKEIWFDNELLPYKKFYNMLTDANEQHYEPFGAPHKDWGNRIKAPYIFFNSSVEYTNFKLDNPLHVAYCEPKVSMIETWINNDSALSLRKCLFEKYFKTNRNLRINNIQRAHTHIARHDLRLKNCKI
jgi:hypothetical protein